MSATDRAGAAPVRTNFRGGGAPGAFWRELLESLRHPDFWALSSWLGIIIRSRKSRLGIVWLLMPSAVYVFGLGAFFASIMGRHMEGGYYAYVAIGAMVFRSLMSTVIGSANVFVGGAAFIMDGHTRLTDYVLQSLAKSFFDLCMYVPVLLVALYLSRSAISPWGVVTAAPALLLIYFNALWMATAFALLGARLPDVGQLLSNVSVFLFLLTPIIWHADMLPADSARAHLVQMNPFYHLVELFRAPFFGNPVTPSTFRYVGIMTVTGLGVTTMAYRRYARYVPLWI